MTPSFPKVGVSGHAGAIHPVKPHAFDLVVLSNVGRLNMAVPQAVLKELALQNRRTEVLWAETTYAPDVRAAAVIELEAPSHLRVVAEVVATEPGASSVPIVTQMVLLGPDAADRPERE